MLFSRTSLGVEISPAGLYFARLSGSQASPRLERVAHAPLAPGAMRVSLREVNLNDPAAFTDCFRAGHNLLNTSVTRLSVSIPDAVGRVMIVDIEDRFKNRGEALDIIRWKLKKSIPFEPSETHLDYQQLKIRDNGQMVLLVALVSHTVIRQYEDLIVSAGFSPAAIDFNLFNQYRAFESRLALQDDGALFVFHDNSLGVMFFSGGIPEFIRTKEFSGHSSVESRLFMEVSSSLRVYRERFPDRGTAGCHCIASPQIAADFRAMIAEASGVEPALLEVKSAIRPSDGAPGDQESLFPFTAAIGAAMRNL